MDTREAQGFGGYELSGAFTGHHGYGPAIAHGPRFRPAQCSRSDTREQLYRHNPPAQSARGRTREMLKASGFTSPLCDGPLKSETYNTSSICPRRFKPSNPQKEMSTPEKVCGNWSFFSTYPREVLHDCLLRHPKHLRESALTKRGPRAARNQDIQDGNQRRSHRRSRQQPILECPRDSEPILDASPQMLPET